MEGSMKFEEKMPSQLRQQILMKAKSALNDNKVSRRKMIMKWVFGGLSMAATSGAGFFVFKTSFQKNENQLLAANMDLLETIENSDDLELVAEFDLLEDFDLLENLDFFINFDSIENSDLWEDILETDTDVDNIEEIGEDSI